ncbi:hypothetical protein [Pyxidicoccus xibeiensis]|uniref:hypothetical protein n=1 Tax=Pyxidicoccus xibeiensis TaxID=2906759 RepID=UPI0020A7F7A2|nr:hypothetical protein [Pyxidicoccus xibeiensis]MCP3140126.1 hypothetical protein [Pyxidicoccus xibeiensis]
MHPKRSVVKRSWLSLWLVAGAALAAGCGAGFDVEEGQAPVEDAATVSAQSEYCPASGGYCEVASGSVFCGAGRPRASAFQTPDGWCIHASACGPSRPICTPGSTEN